MTDYEKLEERRQMARSNYYAQLEMLGYDSGGNPLDDIVRVVRCKDCKYRDPEDKWCDCGGMEGLILPRQDDWFCADGERRDDDGSAD